MRFVISTSGSVEVILTLNAKRTERGASTVFLHWWRLEFFNELPSKLDGLICDGEFDGELESKRPTGFVAWEVSTALPLVIDGEAGADSLGGTMVKEIGTTEGAGLLPNSI